jgi:hypothetical protein
LPNSPLLLYAAIALVFVLGAVLYRLGSQRVRVERTQRESRAASAGVTWPRLVDEELSRVDAGVRLDMVERLGIVNTEWSREILKRALTEETDERITHAIRAALLAD